MYLGLFSRKKVKKCLLFNRISVIIYGLTSECSESTVVKGGANHGEMRYLRKRRFLWNQGFSLASALEQSMEAECKTGKGCCKRQAVSNLCLHSLPAFRQGNPLGIKPPFIKSLTYFKSGFFVVIFSGRGKSRRFPGG